ncbi:sulfatase-like hydrolase/transferase [Profundibacter sp.]
MQPKKNILLIAFDDAFAFWRYRTAFGAQLKTPNLDRICSVSTVFKSAYCQVPVCGPSRASAMSGLSPYETGVFDNYTDLFDVLRPEQVWSYRLKRDGYYCSTAGKIHHGYKPQPDRIHNVLYSHPSRKVHFGPAKNAAAVPFGGRMDGRGTTNRIEDRQYYDFRSSQDAIRFLKSYDSETPFYREVGLHNPHPPFRTPIRFKEMYDLDDFIQPEEWAEGFDLSEFTARYMVENMDLSDIDNWKKSVRNYFSGFSHADFHIGRIWKILQQSKYAKNTIVIFFSDHGYHMGDKGRFRKFTLWEEAARIPFIVYDPDQPAREIEEPVALVDMGPTVLDYAGCKPMRHSVGKSLRPVVEGATPQERSVPTFWYGSASVRKGAYRTTLYQNGSAEFYNVEKDMWLTKNLADKSPKFESAKQDLLKTCKEYGVHIIEKDVPTDKASPYYSIQKGAATPKNLGTSGTFTIGSMDSVNESPGYKKQFSALETNDTIKLANGVNELHYAADTNGGVTRFKVVGNSSDNKFIFKGGHNRFVLEIDTGPGNNLIRVSHDTLVLRTGSGNNIIEGGVGDSEVFAGSGNNTITATAGNNIVHGGDGNDIFYGGTGEDKITSGNGTNAFYSGAGKDTIAITGGVNHIYADQGETVLVFMRTELPQTVESFSSGLIDLSDWAIMGKATVTQQNDDVIISCRTEKITIKNASLKTVLDFVIGIELETSQS